MSRQHVHQMQGLSGTERYGAVPGAQQAALVPTYMSVAGTEPAPPSGIKFGIRGQCMGENKEGFQCGAPRQAGSEYCVGHTKRIAKKLKEQTELILKEQENLKLKEEEAKEVATEEQIQE